MKYEEILAEIIKSKTVSEYDQKDMSCFYAFQDKLKELFPNIFKVAQMENFGGSFVLVWKGKTSVKRVLFMNHQDVVDAVGAWEHEPFGGEISEGKVWGRGTLDTKGGLFGMLMAADELVSEGFVPNCDIWFESSCCEETGSGKYGCPAIVEELKSRGIRFDFSLDEGGMILYEPISGAKGTFAMVGVAERGFADLKFTAKSNGGHASTPEKDSPLVRLGKFMAEVDSKNVFDAQLSESVSEMFKRLSVSMNGPLKFVLGHPGFFKKLLEKILPNVSASANALLRTTVAFTMAQGSGESNVIPESAWVVGNMRYSHHQGLENSVKAISKIADKYGLETTVINHGGTSGVSSFKTAYFKLMEDAVSKSYPGVVTSPYIQTGASDSRFLTDICDNVYRFVPFLISQKQLETVHGIDENVDVSTLEPAVKFYKYLMTNL